MKISNYLKNTYVVLGLIGISFYIYKRRKLIKTNPKVKKSVEELEEKSSFVKKVDEPKVGQKFIDDVEKMDKTTLKRTMETNKKLLKRAKMSNKKRDMIKDMLAYMKDEYDSKTRKK